MTKFFDLFPQMLYGNDTYKQLYTNFLVRMKILDDIKNNISSYYEFDIPEGDTMDILAEKVYGHPEYHWIIAMTNDMIDPLSEWPKDYNTFIKYIKNKYGSVANAANQNHHYEKKIERLSQDVQYTDVSIFNIDEDYYNDNPHYSFVNWTLSNGVTITEEISLSAVNCYDWETDENERRRHIKIIKKEYLPQIIQEFNKIMDEAGSSAVRGGLRTLRNF